ncbi:MAG TPA: ANTAR domain-containing protein [Bryobacteraceae bacterium]|nr:ANTAR domain-containing protein [Bryobacteraceae bacterium]
MEPPTSQVTLLQRISNIVSSHRSVDEMLGEIVGLTVQVTDCDACLVYLLDPVSGDIILRASQVPHAGEIGLLTIQSGEGITGWVVEHKSAVALSKNAASDPRFICVPGLVEDTYEAFCSVPLVSGGDIIGVINVHHREEHEYAPEAVSLLTFIGEQMGGAVARAHLLDENLRLHEETLEMKRQLETRKLVERAKGILQFKYNLTEEEAYLRLRNESRRLRRPMRDLAEAIILTEDLARKSGEPASLEREVEGD